MNILLFTEYFPESEKTEITGGVEARCFNLAKILSKKNKVTIITSWRHELKRHCSFLGMNVIRVGPEHKYSNSAGFISRSIFVMYAIKEGLKHKECDIVSGENFTTYYPAFVVAKRLKKPCVITYHETWVGEWIKNKGHITGLPYEIYERLLHKLKYDRIISVSRFTKKRLIDKRIRCQDIEVINNGINIKEFDFSSKKEKLPTICYIGRLVKTKRTDVLIKAVSLLKKKGLDIRCNIIGKGEFRPYLEDLTNKLGLKENIRFFGFIKDPKEVRKILKSSTIFCFPSIVEGFGIAIIEAMASGTPYVCSDLEVLKEITENGKGGMLFEKNNEIDLANKLYTLFNNKKIIQTKRAEGLSFVKKYQWKTIAEQVEKTYKEAIKEYNS